VRRLAFSIALVAAMLVFLETEAAGSRASATQSCRVSKTSSHVVPGRSSFNFGNARIATHLPEGATFVAVPEGKPGGGMAFIQKDGWIRTKLGWFTPRVTPRVTGRRTDGTGRALHVDMGVRSYANGPFYPSLLYFPSLGCWRITATAGGSHLVAIVDVRR
jgi:hypothetical protein